MKNAIYPILLIILATLSAIAQDPDNNGNALNFPFRKYGISIGNSHEFSGLRINLINKNVEKINGLNITGFGGENNMDARLTGVNVSAFQMAGKMQFVNLGILGMMADELNGISAGDLLVGAIDQMNGFSASGLVTMVEGGDMTGAALSGLMIFTEDNDADIRGLAVAGLLIACDGGINGLPASLMIYSANNINGVALGPAII